MNFKKLYWYSAVSVIIFYLSICLYMYAFQRSFLYLPHVNNHLLIKTLNVDAKEVRVPSTDGITLKSWFYNNPANSYTVLFFHGNAGELTNRFYKLNEFKNLHLNYLIISWRGFSGNSGKPTEKGLYDDANSAIRWLEKNNIPKDKIILYGESLGTGIAVEVAQQQNFAGVILESPYTSMVDTAKIYYPYLPVNLILKDKYKSIDKIKNITSPILVMHGAADLVVPFSMGQQIFDAAQSKKYSYFPAYGKHMMSFTPSLKEAINNFINNLNN
jgi:fermentation-respiration switch protein FrsA (DUF1100 family)